MKHLGIIVIIVISFSACTAEKCTRICLKDFNLSVLPLWEKQTDVNLAYRKNNKLISLFKSAARDSISIFDRRVFFEEISGLSQLGAYDLDSLVVVEVKRSGEVYTSRKYLLGFCGQEVIIIKFQSRPEKWEFIRGYRSEARKLDAAVKSLTERSDNTIYWGNRITDLVAVSTFRGNNDVSVEVLGTLSEKQSIALDIIER